MKLQESTHNTGVYKVYNQVYFHLYPRSVHILRSISHEHYTIAMSEEWNIFLSAERLMFEWHFHKKEQEITEHE